MKYISFILLFPFLFKGCFGELESNDHRLTFTNSGNSILYGAISQDKLDNSTNIVDYTVPKTAKTEFVEFNQEKSFGGEGANYWTDFVNNSKSKSVNIFVIEKNIYFQNDWDSICNKKLYTKANFTLKQLEAVNWSINLDSIKKHNRIHQNL